MFVVPLKWLPWLLLIGGLILLLSGDADLWTVLLTIGSGIWIFFQQKDKKNQPNRKENTVSGNNSQKSSQNYPAVQNAVTPVQNISVPQNTSVGSSMRKCPYCGNMENSEMLFCSKCGGKL